MRKFWSDYGKLCKASGEFYKEHWFGVIVLNLVSIALWFSPSIVRGIKSKVNSKKESKKN